MTTDLRERAGAAFGAKLATGEPAAPADTEPGTPANGEYAPEGAADDLLTKDEILGFEDRRYETFPVRAWGGRLVRIRSLTSRELDKYQSSIVEDRKDGSTRTVYAQARAKLCVLVMVDGKGNRVFGDTDVGKLGEKSAAAVHEIWERAASLSGMMKKDLEELAGNSESDHTGAS